MVYALRPIERELLDKCFAKAMKLGRPFTEKEVFGIAWKEGCELTPEMDERFVVAVEKKNQRLYGIAGVQYRSVKVINDNCTITDKIEQIEYRGWRYGSSQDIFGKNDIPDEEDFCYASNVRLYFWRPQE